MSSTTTQTGGAENLQDIWSDIGNIAIKIANIAVDIIPVLLVSDNLGRSRSLQAGPLYFSSYLHSSGGGYIPFVQNLGDQEYLLVMNQAEGNKDTQLIVVGPSGSSNYTQDIPSIFSDFEDGVMTMAPVKKPETRDVSGYATNILATGVASIMFGAAFQLFPGISAKTTKDANGRPIFIIKTEPPVVRLDSVEIEVKDCSGNSVSFKNKLKSLEEANSEYIFYVPGGITLNPSFDLSCTIEVDEENYKAITRS